MAGYDPKKAALYNKLRQSGLSDEAAAQQAGISSAERDSDYVVNDEVYNNDGTKNTNRGQIGPVVYGSGTITEAPTAAEQKESAQFYKGLESNNFERVDYPVKADSQPSNKTPINYTTTSTEQVSGGGSTTTTSGQFKENAQTRSLQPAIDAKQAELTQSYKDYPVSNRGREKAGLPLLTPDELQANQQRATEISKEKVALEYKQQDAGTPGEPTVTTVPNTTTSESTTTYSKSVANSGLENATDIQSPGGADPTVNAQTETQIALNNTQVESAVPATASDPFSVTPRSLAPGEELVQNDAPAPVDTPLLTPAESIAQAQVSAPEAVDAGTFNANTNAGVLGAIGVPESAPADVDPTTDPGVRSPFGGAASNAAAAQNPEAAAAALQQEQANQAAVTKRQAQAQQALAARRNIGNNGDWRFKIQLAPNATYLYNDGNNKILAPLRVSGGVIFPYTPQIDLNYTANYERYDLVHSNYRGYFYKNSAVNEVSVRAKFTAQDTAEAQYLLAVITFFKSVTKMFYGQDPEAGTPPPLVYISGFGQYQFNQQACVVANFAYNLPADVDYIRADSPNQLGLNLDNRNTRETGLPPAGPLMTIVNRLRNANLFPGALPQIPTQSVVRQNVNNINPSNATYVPTKIELSLTLLPIQTRSEISQQFSLKSFANGDLIKGGFW